MTDLVIPLLLQLPEWTCTPTGVCESNNATSGGYPLGDLKRGNCADQALDTRLCPRFCYGKSKSMMFLSCVRNMPTFSIVYLTMTIIILVTESPSTSTQGYMCD